MGKAFHKPRPSVPRWYFLDNDGCWFCKFRNNQRGCTGCKLLKKQVAKDKKKRDKKEKQQFDF